MRKILLMMSVSLDGFMEGPNRELDWHLVDDELHGHFNEELGSMGAFLDERVTYELMAEFSRIWRDMPKVVLSKTLSSAGWTWRHPSWATS